ncbi:MAG: hydroxymethylglutaryl-CoA lyase [Dethiosulfatibacter sp.]|nr:hydroxymethylglutaryl-CoA lyase [Dethiosulfatibacter sp.]
MNKKIIITEVGPRDGFQNEKQILDTATKAELINKSIDAGFKSIEFGYFADPARIPELADAEGVYKLLNKPADVELKALVEDIDGLKRAIAVGVKSVKISVSASNTYNLKKFQMTSDETLETIRDRVELARNNDIKLSCGVSTSFGCPYEGKMTIETINRVVKKLIDMGIEEIFIADTAGMGNPREVKEVFLYFINKYPDTTFSAHFHNTRGMGLANAYAAMEAGVTRFDSSFGGLGGCPYVAGAKGNVSSEDLIYMTHEMGYETGVELDKAIEVARYLEKVYGKEMNSYILKAGKATDIII